MPAQAQCMSMAGTMRRLPRNPLANEEWQAITRAIFLLQITRRSAQLQYLESRIAQSCASIPSVDLESPVAKSHAWCVYEASFPELGIPLLPCQSLEVSYTDAS